MSEAPSDGTRSRDLRDIVAVVLLSTMAVLTAWCGFQASKWGGEMSIAFSQASSARVQATNYEGQARDQRQFDLTVYASWVEATAAGNEQLAAFIEERFHPDFRVAFDAWQAQGGDEGGPFVQDEYVPAGTEQAAEYSARADEKFAEALENNQRGDDYSLLTVLFALVLFLTAMSQRKIAAWASRVFLGLGVLVGLVGVGILLTFPIRI